MEPEQVMRQPDYVRLNIPFDRENLVEFVHSLPRETFPITAPIKYEKSRFPYEFNQGVGFDICTNQEYDRLSYDRWDGYERIHVPGEFGTFTQAIFTHPKTRPELIDQFTVIDPEGRICRTDIIHTEPWEWRSDIDTTLLEEQIAGLPFEYLLQVRIIVLWEGEHIGNVHRDAPPFFNDPWRIAGFGRINLNVLDGGSTLNIKMGDRILITNDSAFSFNDSLFHGVTRSDRLRIQVSVTGKLDQDRFRAYWDTDSLEYAV